MGTHLMSAHVGPLATLAGPGRRDPPSGFLLKVSALIEVLESPHLPFRGFQHSVSSKELKPLFLVYFSCIPLFLLHISNISSAFLYFSFIFQIFLLHSYISPFYLKYFSSIPHLFWLITSISISSYLLYYFSMFPLVLQFIQYKRSTNI